MTGGLSLRARLLAGLGFVVVLLVLVAVSVTSLTRRHLVDQVDERLAAAVQSRAVLAGSRPTAEIADGAGPDGAFRGPLIEFWEGYFTVRGELREQWRPNFGRSSEYSPDLGADEALAAMRSGSARTVASTEPGGHRWRAVVVQAASGRPLVFALPLDEVDDTIRRLVLVELVASAAVIAVLGAVAWWVIHLGIRPVQQMTAVAATIAAGDLSQRVPESAPSSEAGQLGQALNHMLEQLESAFDERAASQERLQQFVADASHELRTPVTTIRGYAELYRIGGLATEGEVAEAMRRTEQEAVRMARLVDDMLALARLGAGRPLDIRDVDVAGLVDDAARDARAVAPARPVTVDGSGPVMVRGDEDRLRQVLANVVGNALTHTPPDTPIELRIIDHGDRVAVEVIDHGPGMTPEVAAKVTERFYRADPARSRDHGGSGLGMAIVDATVSAHGGSVDVESAPGRGTTVRVTLPAPSHPG